MPVNKVFIDEDVIVNLMPHSLLKKMGKTDEDIRPYNMVLSNYEGDFLGFVVHKKDIKINQNKTKAIVDLKPPLTKKQLQYLLGKINFLRRFISNLSGKIKSFSPLLRLNKDNDFIWGSEQQEAFDNIKQYLMKPPILLPPSRNRSMKLYIVASDSTIGNMLAQEDHNGVESAIYYLSRILINAKTRYKIKESCSNNEVLYEALITDLQILLDLGARDVEIKGNSKLVVRQLKKEYKCIKENLMLYFVKANNFLKCFDHVLIDHIPQLENQEANDLAQRASGYKISKERLEDLVEIKEKLVSKENPQETPSMSKLGGAEEYEDPPNLENF
ncbi:uncharacterized protein LOC127102258 [Lathyrus oleraceus]|uniref:uncharacterized protein LOC127102258 n=1 Tax=Pisum sativum TaxID=3888 RepID=UPI0021D3089A|nr:uncharacterized protein LOC127102258 [Pisum sativum]